MIIEKKYSTEKAGQLIWRTVYFNGESIQQLTDLQRDIYIAMAELMGGGNTIFMNIDRIKDILVKCGFKPVASLRTIKELIELGFLVQKGKGKKERYYFTSKGLINNNQKFESKNEN